MIEKDPSPEVNPGQIRDLIEGMARWTPPDTDKDPTVQRIKNLNTLTGDLLAAGKTFILMKNADFENKYAIKGLDELLQQLQDSNIPKVDSRNTKDMIGLLAWLL